MKQKKRVINFKKARIKLLFVIAYFILAVQFLEPLFNVIRSSFPLFDDTEWAYIVLVFGFALIIALLLSFPTVNILHKFFGSSKSEKEEYTPISDNVKKTFETDFLRVCIAGLTDETAPVKPIKDLIANKKYDEAIEFGLLASQKFLDVDNHFLRVLCGLYIIKATCDGYNPTTSDRYDYIRYSVKVNELGWSLYKLDHIQFEKLADYFNQNDDLTSLKFEDKDKFVADRLAKIKIELIGQNKFPTLCCEALEYWHIISQKPLSLEELNILKKRVKNRDTIDHLRRLFDSQQIDVIELQAE
ncbi:MAG: hypothetical protein FWC80_00700 [Firmicutes bacterium]|nr:hypothetical protein [Bacillota bacterium]